MDASGGGRQVTLSTYKGARVTVVKTDASANLVAIVPTSGTVNGAANDSLASQYSRGTYVCDGTNWFKIA